MDESQMSRQAEDVLPRCIQMNVVDLAHLFVSCAVEGERAHGLLCGYQLDDVLESILGLCQNHITCVIQSHMHLEINDAMPFMDQVKDSVLIDGLSRSIGLQCFAVLTKQKYEDLDPSIKRIVGAGDCHTDPSIKSQEILACSFWSTSRPPTQLMTTIICSSVPQVYLRRWSFQVPVYLPQMPDIPSAPPDMLDNGKRDPIVAVVEDWMSDILDILVQLTVTRLWAQAMIAMQEDDENYDMSKLQRMRWMMPNKGV